MAKIELHNVSVQFPVYSINARSLKKKFLRAATGGAISENAHHHIMVRALDNISLCFKNGDRIGLIGHNGSGKSTLLRLLAKIYEPNTGWLDIEGKVSPLLDIMHGIEAELTGYENIKTRGTILGLNQWQIREKTAEIAEFSGLGSYLAMPLRTYSSGMMMRLAFAISTCIHPDILVIDEVFGTGDTNFMKQARSKMVSLLDQSNIVIIATHSDELIKEFCNKVLLLTSGRVQYFGETSEGLALYQDQNR